MVEEISGVLQRTVCAQRNSTQCGASGAATLCVKNSKDGALSDPSVSGLLLGSRRKPAYTEKALVLSAHVSYVAESVPHSYACSTHRGLRVCHAGDATAQAHAFADPVASARASGQRAHSRCAVAAFWKEGWRAQDGSAAHCPFQPQPGCENQACTGRETEACARRARVQPRDWTRDWPHHRPARRSSCAPAGNGTHDSTRSGTGGAPPRARCEHGFES